MAVNVKRSRKKGDSTSKLFREKSNIFYGEGRTLDSSYLQELETEDEFEADNFVDYIVKRQ